mmetsp:Transcript_52032/g.100566  ORF Transcript_52032/g.100566 Transcript_52032/m.100566 type:complete len:468 (+) Transcript_52032:94-1497(+)
MLYTTQPSLGQAARFAATQPSAACLTTNTRLASHREYLKEIGCDSKFVGSLIMTFLAVQHRHRCCHTKSRKVRRRQTSTAAIASSTTPATSVSGSKAEEAAPCRSTPAPSDLLLRVARGESGCRHTPVWLMRQAGRYMKAFRAYSERYPFRQRSETPDMAVELSLQCWRRFGMDGVIVFSDILTPLPALGIEFDVIRGRGPVVLGDLGRCLEDRLEGPKAIGQISEPEDFQATHGFLRESLERLREQTEGSCTLLGFVGAPWTLAAYAVEGGGTKDAAIFKRWMYEKPAVADEFLRRVAVSIANYAIFQVRSGAQCVQLFDSWAHCLGPEQWVRFAAPHVRFAAEQIRAACPDVPLIYFAHGGSGYLRDQVEALDGCVNVLGIDAKMRMHEAAKVVEGSGIVLQGNVDPFILRHGSEVEVRDAVRRTIDQVGGPGRHIMNLGHGVMQGTPEENVLYFVEEAQTYCAN